MSVVSLASLSNGGYMEIKSKHMQYSKFLNVGVAKKEDDTKLSSINPVLFLHKYSGSMALESAIVISLSYTLSTATMIYAQYLSKDFPEPLVDLKYVGIGIFVVGIIGNFYHHNILANLRKKGKRRISCISQTLYAVALALGTILYLTGRSYATREWANTHNQPAFPVSSMD
ncbi:hypothetical protein L1887_16312 [Cichorium endivia]|nr:hypothetical protein L1887_16312 [Cichorium endivia]